MQMLCSDWCGPMSGLENWCHEWFKDCDFSMRVLDGCGRARGVVGQKNSREDGNERLCALLSYA